MRALAAAIIVLAGSILIAAEVQTSHLHPDPWGLFLGLPIAGFGLLGCLVEMFRQDANSYTKP
jgi:hypothetical protein